MHGLSDILLPLYKKEHMEKLPGAQFWLPMHLAYAQYKSLISNTDIPYFITQIVAKPPLGLMSDSVVYMG